MCLSYEDLKSDADLSSEDVHLRAMVWGLGLWEWEKEVRYEVPVTIDVGLTAEDRERRHREI